MNSGILGAIPWTRWRCAAACGLSWFARGLLQRRHCVACRQGVWFDLDLTEGIDLAVFLFGAFQRHVGANPHFRLAPDAIVLDVGANVGAMALHYARQVPEGRVYAFEPTCYAFQKLQRNIGLNPTLAPRIAALQTFVVGSGKVSPPRTAYASWKVDRLAVPGRHPIGCGIPMAAEGASAATIDSFCKAQSVPRVDLIKIDTEGHEWAVLQGAAETIRRFRPVVVFEAGQYLCEEQGISPRIFWQFFEPLGYRILHAKRGWRITADQAAHTIPQRATVDLVALP